MGESSAKKSKKEIAAQVELIMHYTALMVKLKSDLEALSRSTNFIYDSLINSYHELIQKKRESGRNKK